jgi:hypothetical protein
MPSAPFGTLAPGTPAPMSPVVHLLLDQRTCWICVPLKKKTWTTVAGASETAMPRARGSCEGVVEGDIICAARS